MCNGVVLPFVSCRTDAFSTHVFLYYHSFSSCLKSSLDVVGSLEKICLIAEFLPASAVYYTFHTTAKLHNSSPDVGEPDSLLSHCWCPINLNSNCVLYIQYT